MSSVDDAVRSMIANLEARSGKSLAQWLRIARGSKLTKHGEILRFLKEQHGLGHGYANLVALRTLAGSETPSGGDLTAAQYAGDKSRLRPLYEAILGAARAFGDDVEVAPKKAYTSLRRRKQFALVQPTTAERLDVGLNLKGVPAKGRLEPSGSFNAMVTHRVRVTRRADLDRELIGWLRTAYERA